MSKLSTRQRLNKKLILNLLSRVRFGVLKLIDEDGESHTFGDESFDLTAEVKILSPEFYSKILRGGSVAAAELYMDGAWESNDVTKTVQLMARNLHLLDELDAKVSRFVKFLRFKEHKNKHNNRENVAANVAYHYDLGNDFYSLFLDSTLLYSSAIFSSNITKLGDAQVNKVDKICQLLNLSSGDKLLEIGTGWGFFSVYAAKRYGVNVTTITISKEQFDHASKLIADEGLIGQVDVQLVDYRDVKGKFDKIVSVEMIEAVGEQYLSTFFSSCQKLLNPGGKLCLQAITIADQRYEYYRKKADFIQKYIFPGGFLPSLTSLLDVSTSSSKFIMRSLSDHGSDYALTLDKWQENFRAKKNEVLSLGFDEKFYRMWDFYFSYCSGGLREKSISGVQLLFELPRFA